MIVTMIVAMIVTMIVAMIVWDGREKYLHQNHHQNH